MLNTLSKFLTRISTPQLVTAYFIVALVIMAFIIPRFNTLIKTLPPGMGLPDQLFYYDADKLGQMAQAYGEHGRRLYVRSALTYDLAWPILYTSFLCMAISYFNNYGFKPDNPLHQLNLTPFIPAGFDGLENLNISLVMLNFPHTEAIWLNTAGIFTAGKWISVGLCFTVLGLSIIHAIRHRFHKPS